jgi:D-alanyl-D-alanine carboxypeptidase
VRARIFSRQLGLLAAMSTLGAALAVCHPAPLRPVPLRASAAPGWQLEADVAAAYEQPAAQPTQARDVVVDSLKAPSAPMATSDIDSSSPSAVDAHDTAVARGDAGTPRRQPPWELECLAKHYAVKPARYWSHWTMLTEAGERLYYVPVRGDAGMEVGLRDIFVPKYQRAPLAPTFIPQEDPGTTRHTALFEATYGKGLAEIHARLRMFDFFGTQMRIHERVLVPMQRVIAKIHQAKNLDPSYQVYLEHLGGTYNHRVIAGTDILSPHAFGIAIDLSTHYANYWRTDPPGPNATKAPWKNAIPEPIVSAFESEGFIWGGRWLHFDTMHFEYRPELLDPTCAPAQSSPIQ